VQGGFYLHRTGVHPLPLDSLFIDERAAYLVNPGSVGQPRDHDPRAAFAIYDSELRRVEFDRAEYDAALTSRKIFEAGLPEVLGLRLFRGA
jgi:diadenosine tetraphosphatase ApaH/serine/threonine PP2A family protein phosphatase